MVAESWFRSLWKTARKHEVGLEKVLIGVLAFEVASLMSKLVHLWQCLSDKQVVKLREEIMNSVGIRKLVSEDDFYIVCLISAEMTENLGAIARVVARLAKKCIDPLMRSFESAFDELIKIGADPNGWKYTWKKMDRKVKKMERLIMENAKLYQAMEALADIEQTLRRMKGNDGIDSVSLLEYEKKAAWKQQEVKHLKEISLWNRSYDYTVRLLARSLFTIFCRTGHVFGINHVVDVGITDHRSQSVSVLMQSSVHPENRITRFSSGPLDWVNTKSGPISRTNKRTNCYSGPLGNSVATSSPGPISERHKNYSGLLGRLTTKSGPLPKANKTGLRFWHSRDNSLTHQGRSMYSKSNQLSTIGPFKGCMLKGHSSPVSNCYLNLNGVYSGIQNGNKDADMDHHAHGNVPPPVYLSNFRSKHSLLDAPPETLGAAALALHYANVIIVIEKLVASPHLIGQDARDDLYNMLPASVRAALRVRLKPYAKSLASSVYDTVLAEEWSEAMTIILEWLAPLAHNMIRWQSQHSFEHQNLVSQTNVLLVQTLYFANQEKTEATITELLIGLNYIWRFGRELDAKVVMECASGGTIDDSLGLDG